MNKMAASTKQCLLISRLKSLRNSASSLNKWTCTQCLRPLVTAAPKPAINEVRRWQLVSSICLERLPVVTQEMTSIEKEMSALFAKMDVEYSCLSDHELRHIEDLKLAERRKRDDLDENELDMSGRTAVEAEDAWEEELREFKPASRITEADEKNDVRSTNRKLDRQLVLLVKQKLGNSQHWVMPMGVNYHGESMRQSAERVLSSLCGNQLDTLFLGNAPYGYLKYKYPETVRQNGGFYGAKVFFFKAQLRAGQVACSADVADHVWVGHDELSRYVTPAYYRRIQKFMLDFC